MKLVPFSKYRYETSMTSAELKNRFQVHTNTAAELKLSNKSAFLKTFDGDFQQRHFRIVKNENALHYSRPGFLPILVGEITERDNIEKNFLSIKIHPSVGSIIILIIVYVLLVIGLCKGISESDYKLIGFALIFFLVTYASVLIAYNKEHKEYKSFFERTILAGNLVKI